MSQFGVLWTLVCSVIVVIANVALRLCMDRTGVKLFSSGALGVPSEVVELARDPMLYLALASYAGAMLIWFRLAATEPLSVAYPVLVAMSFVGVAAADAILLHQALVPQRVVGILVMIIGIVLISGA